MAFFPPVALIRKKHIIKQLKKHGAVSESTAITFNEADIINPDKFKAVTKTMLNRNILAKTADGHFYLKPQR